MAVSKVRSVIKVVDWVVLLASLPEIRHGRVRVYIPLLLRHLGLDRMYGRGGWSLQEAQA